jgi:hypothetical protein
VVLVAVAHLIGLYNQLVSEVSTSNNIVVKIMKAAQKAKIMMMTLSHPVLALDGIL